MAKQEKVSKTEKLANHLAETGDAMTAAAIRKKFSIQDVPSAVRRLREDGICVYTNTDKQGKTRYRVGKPSREMVQIAMMALGADVFTR